MRATANARPRQNRLHDQRLTLALATISGFLSYLTQLIILNLVLRSLTSSLAGTVQYLPDPLLHIGAGTASPCHYRCSFAPLHLALGLTPQTPQGHLHDRRL